MALYRDALPQLSGEIFLTDGGLETTLIFEHDLDLPEFAAYPLLATDDGKDLLRQYFRSYADVAKDKYRVFMGIATGRSLLRKLCFENNLEDFRKLLVRSEAVKVQNALSKIVLALGSSPPASVSHRDATRWPDW